MDRAYVDCPQHGTVQPPTYKTFSAPHPIPAVFQTARLRALGTPMYPPAYRAFNAEGRDAFTVRLGKTEYAGYCEGCETLQPARIIKHSKQPKGYENEGQCTTSCLNGKRECSCKCEGLCHGNGICQCGNPGARVQSRGLVKL